MRLPIALSLFFGIQSDRPRVLTGVKTGFRMLKPVSVRGLKKKCLQPAKDFHHETFH